MSSRDIRVLEDDYPTVEEEAPDFDPSRTDQVERPTFVSARDDGPGAVEHDESGQARWTWATEQDGPSSEAEKTFDELEALTNDRLALEDSPAAEPAPSPQSGYNPYDTKSPQPPQPPRKRR
jgi:hypothetical protein